MATMTLLEMVQDIMSDMDSDEINSISDTIEGSQVAQILKTTFFKLIANRTIPEHRAWVQLTALGDVVHPNYLKLPSGVFQADECTVYYDKFETGDTDRDYQPIHYKLPRDFLNLSLGRNSGDTTIDIISDFGGADLLIDNDKHPDWWTSFDDEHVVFDSYKKTEDTTIQASKSGMWVQQIPSWTTSDTFVPDIDETLFPLLLAEAKTRCFVKLKQTTDPTAQADARELKIGMQNDRHRFKHRNFRTGPDFGRHGPQRFRAPNFGRRG